ncbi:MAG: DNA-protecting protein DprA [Oscillospiraceae bacterium]|nr:DNA-protecting protein DprA [Oscillospiraceae bacterium]
MRAAERGLLMLTCSLGDPGARPLSAQQYVAVGKLLLRSPSPRPEGEKIRSDDLRLAGVGEEYSEQILRLLSREKQLDRYLEEARNHGVEVITRLSEDYPKALVERLGDDAPTVLFCKGDRSLLRSRFVSLVGSRRLGEIGFSFAERVGALAARDGITLVSGGAPGADRTAQDACLRCGGNVLIFTPERLDRLTCGENVLLVSEGGWELPFSSERALSRNRLIHAMGEKTFVAQCTYRRGGTWRGTMHNLRYKLSPVFVCEDGTTAASSLIEEGAFGVTEETLESVFPG